MGHELLQLMESSMRFGIRFCPFDYISQQRTGQSIRWISGCQFSDKQVQYSLIGYNQHLGSNELPPDIRKLSTLATFKNHLKTFLFCKHYGLVLEQ